MNPLTRLGRTCLILGLMIAAPNLAAAHRLDEYLQATRISIERDQVGIEINLTPGVEIVHRVLALIDSNRDGEISEAEASAYAASVVESMQLLIDGKPKPLTLHKISYPSVDAMRRGDGIIRFRVTGPIEPAGEGAHRLQFENAHRPDISVYLVNALLPSDERIAITGQSRDFLQRSYEVDYTVSLEKNPLKKAAAALPVLLGLAMAGTFFAIASKFN